MEWTSNLRPIRLSEKEANFYQKRLNHLLTSFRESEDISARDLATYFEFSNLKSYYRFEGSKPYGTIISCFTFLKRLAHLNQMSIRHVVEYFENESSTDKSSRDELRPWEKTLISEFSKRTPKQRYDFIPSILAHASKDEEHKEKFDLLLSIVSKLNRLSNNQIQLLHGFLSSIDALDTQPSKDNE